MDQAPIDIRYGELLNWLEARYLIPKDWAKRLELITVKKNEFIEDLYKKDSAEMKKIQDSFKIFRNNTENMTFNDVMRLNTILSKTEEAKAKTLFGYPTSQLIKDSNLLCEIYKKNNMNLAESSKLIIQYIGYEIPNLEKNSQYNERTVNDYESKINEKSSQTEKNNGKIRDLFKRFCIEKTDKASDIALALVGRLSSLEKLLKEIDANLINKKITHAIQIYQNFYKMIFQHNIEDVDKDVLGVLKRVNQEGDFVIGKGNSDKSTTAKYQIIQAKIDEYKQKYQNIDIQADIEAQMWNFKLVNTDQDQDQGKDSYRNSLTALLNPQTRRQIKNDLNELLIFLTHRLNQMDNKDEINLSIYQDNLRKINLELTPELLQDCKKFIINLLSLLDNPDLQFLLNIFEDEKNIKLISNSFEILRNENQSLQNSISDLRAKIDELKKEIVENEKKAAQFKKDAKLIKKQMEKFLTDSLKRKITIIGDINLLT